MPVKDTADISGAFKMLIEEIESEISFINKKGSDVFEKGEYEPASALLAKIKAKRKDVKPQRKRKGSKTGSKTGVISILP